MCDSLCSQCVWPLFSLLFVSFKVVTLVCEAQHPLFDIAVMHVGRYFTIRSNKVTTLVTVNPKELYQAVRKKTGSRIGLRPECKPWVGFCSYESGKVKCPRSSEQAQSDCVGHSAVCIFKGREFEHYSCPVQIHYIPTQMLTTLLNCFSLYLISDHTLGTYFMFYV